MLVGWRPSGPTTTASRTCPTSRGSRRTPTSPTPTAPTAAPSGWRTSRRVRPRDPVALLLHGEPTWSFLYRHVMAVLADAGIRAIAPDLVGFGRSDKPTRSGDHSFARHVEWMRALAFDHLDLRDVTARRPGLGRPDRAPAGGRAPRPVRPCGGRQHRPAHRRLRHAGDLVAVPPGRRDAPRSSTSAAWSHRAACGGLGDRDAGGLRRALPRRGVEGRAPGDARPSCRPAPTTRPARPTAPPGRCSTTLGEAVPHRLQRLATRSPVRWRPILRKLVPGTRGLVHPTIAGAGHFLQEDAGTELGRVVRDFITP